MGLTMFYVPYPSRDSAEQIIRFLIQNRFIACANIIVSESHFFWEDTLTKSEEFIVVMKTWPEKVDDVRNKILSMHPYETPAVIHWPASCNETFESWVQFCVSRDET
ncbi:MAG: divalent-cation tolerance protein CutA [Saprospiraceae bacterium]|jgi:periplasmic divalent cation tolerance protein|nr:divalent-cation tolerance protein CutA [Saprospiraceae bacterium]